MTHSDSWNPPNEPDPNAILEEAVLDAMAGRCAVALAKHQWFYRQALEYCPSLSSVRLSFALGYWLDLAKVYPPAMDSLLELRDDAESLCRESGFEFERFQELAALNCTLGKQDSTVEMFKIVDGTDKNAACRIYHVAEPCLIRRHEYSLCGRYLEPQRRLDLAISICRRAQQVEREHASDGGIPRTAQERFVHDVTTLMALLVKNNRHTEARWVGEKAWAEIADESIRSELDSALEGNIPSD